MLIDKKAILGKKRFELVVGICSKHGFVRGFGQRGLCFPRRALAGRTGIVEERGAALGQKASDGREKCLKDRLFQIIRYAKEAAKADFAALEGLVGKERFGPRRIMKISLDDRNIAWRGEIGAEEAVLFIPCGSREIQFKNLQFLRPRGLAIGKSVIPGAKNQIRPAPIEAARFREASANAALPRGTGDRWLSTIHLSASAWLPRNPG